MSKPLDSSYTPRAPHEQVKYFADVYRDAVSPRALARVQTRARELGLDWSDETALIFAALDHPDKVQTFLNTQIYYYDDHTVSEVQATARSPYAVLQSAFAHCFEGALFAYAVNFLHGYAPRLVLLEASQDADHNLVVYQDSCTGLYGCNAHSAYPHLDGRAAQYRTLRELAESYHPFYYSDFTRDPRDLTLVGYSEPIDLIARYGVAWITSEQPLWEIYYTYIDDRVRFHYLFDDSAATHAYPLIRAVKENWLRVDARGRVFVSPADLPVAAQELWHAFWKTYDASYPRARGPAAEIEQAFRRLTGTTPIDLNINADELQGFLNAGYHLHQLIHEDADG